MKVSSLLSVISICSISAVAQANCYKSAGNVNYDLATMPLVQELSAAAEVCLSEAKKKDKAYAESLYKTLSTSCRHVYERSEGTLYKVTNADCVLNAAVKTYATVTHAEHIKTDDRGQPDSE